MLPKTAGSLARVREQATQLGPSTFAAFIIAVHRKPFKERRIDSRRLRTRWRRAPGPNAKDLNSDATAEERTRPFIPRVLLPRRRERSAGKARAVHNHSAATRHGHEQGWRRAVWKSQGSRESEDTTQHKRKRHAAAWGRREPDAVLREERLAAEEKGRVGENGGTARGFGCIPLELRITYTEDTRFIVLDRQCILSAFYLRSFRCNVISGREKKNTTEILRIWLSCYFDFTYVFS